MVTRTYGSTLLPCFSSNNIIGTLIEEHSTGNQKVPSSIPELIEFFPELIEFFLELFDYIY